MRRILLVAAVWLWAAPAAIAGDAPRRPNNPLLELWQEIRARLDAAVPAPPTPTKVRWRQRSAGAIDLGAPLLDLSAGDLDGDGRAELIAVTSREVIALRLVKAEPVVVARYPLPEVPPPRWPRDPVGALLVEPAADGATIHARTSEQAVGVSLRLRGGELASQGTVDRFPLCDGAAAELEPGRNYYSLALLRGSLLRGLLAQGAGEAGLPAYFSSARCADTLVDPRGYRAPAVAVAGVDGIMVVVRAVRCGDAPGCEEVTADQFTIEGVGYAFAIADVNTDGQLELVTSTNASPGRGDRIDVYTRTTRGELLRLFRTRQLAGGVVGIAEGDLSGRGRRQVVVATRGPGATGIELWTLN